MAKRIIVSLLLVCGGSVLACYLINVTPFTSGSKMIEWWELPLMLVYVTLLNASIIGGAAYLIK